MDSVSQALSLLNELFIDKFDRIKAYFVDILGLFLFFLDFDGLFTLSYESCSDIDGFNFERSAPETVSEKSIIDEILIL